MFLPRGLVPASAVAPPLAVPRVAWLCLAAAGVALAAWLATADLPTPTRWIVVIFALAVFAWCRVPVGEAYVAVAAALAASLVLPTREPFAAIGDPTIVFLVAAFIVAAAVGASGLASRLTLALCSRARTVTELFYLISGATLVTALVLPSTTGRAALLLPVFESLRGAVGRDRRTQIALALLFPTAILLSAIASLLGAGAHLVTAEILARSVGVQLGFAHWLLLGLPFALASCSLSTFVLLQRFVPAAERRRLLTLGAAPLPWTQRERVVAVVLGSLMALWLTEPLHGVSGALVAVAGALVLTAPRFGVIRFDEAVRAVDWTLLVFMAASLELAEALVASGGTAWVPGALSAALSGGATPLAVIVIVAAGSLLAHLVITSRTARSAILVPIVVGFALTSSGDPTLLAFVSTAAAGYCLTLPVSAKAVLVFGGTRGVTFAPRDLMRLSAWLLPIHLVLLALFAVAVWPPLLALVQVGGRP